MNLAVPAKTLVPAAPIKRASPDDSARIASVFAAAFARDPVFDWLAREGVSREAALRKFFVWILSRTIPHGETWVHADGLAAAAWLPPHHETARQSLIEDLRMLPVVVRLTGLKRLTRGAAMAAAMEQAHPRKPCFYLAFIGVAPAEQGAGLGSQILAHTLARIDAAGADAYLENSNPRNIALYERAGFSVTRTIVAHRDAPPIYAMWRCARDQGSRTMSQ